MISYENPPAQPMIPPEFAYIENILKSSRTGLKITSVISLLLSAVVIIGVFVSNFHMIVIAGSPLFFLLLLAAVLLVKISQYKKDLSAGMKTVDHGAVEKKYFTTGKGIKTHTVEMSGKRYIVHGKFYETVSEHDLMDVHRALHSGLILCFYDVSRNTKQELYDPEIRGTWLSTGR
jgi:hypothetical protein